MDPTASSSTGPDHLPPAAAWRAATALSDELRRQMYEFIRRARGPVSREGAPEVWDLP
jgi:hypothetical protein